MITRATTTEIKVRPCSEPILALVLSEARIIYLL
jgi:hypothetical protein